ncbi:flagellin [Nitrosopumilus sp. b1]|uniref:archaellin/type IV pilin N-terminal domain-containing protein n=1 Tax=Nitrosopumilus sp. b1 TaxID=2109907 RepID=UPI0015F4D3E6|nr:archaellin/type IV pilin N-terminal domain-containing protein [Nitrosopumilus sp. b1]KAF6243104.1 flagellin [Nitrosopumilus sp. b1]
MNLIRKGHGHTHRGVIGVESAIVMIAFVIVAAALAFVVLNMGFSTTQKAKTTIISSLGEASSSLEVAGKVIGSGHITDAKLNVTAVPLKIASGGESVNLAPGTASVKYLSNSITYDDIYQDTLTVNTDGDGDPNDNGEWYQLREAVDDAATAGYCTNDPYDTAGDNPNETCAFIYWTVNSNNNDILDQGEHAVLAIVYAKNDRPSALDTIRAEIILPTGASLTIERQVPSITTSVVDLG